MLNQKHGRRKNDIVIVFFVKVFGEPLKLLKYATYCTGPNEQLNNCVLRSSHGLIFVHLFPLLWIDWAKLKHRNAFSHCITNNFRLSATESVGSARLRTVAKSCLILRNSASKAVQAFCMVSIEGLFKVVQLVRKSRIDYSAFRYLKNPEKEMAEKR